MRRPSKSKNHGFSLLEVVTASAILALAIGGTIVTMTVLNHHAAVSRLNTCAQTVAKNQIDRVLNNRFIPQLDDISPELVLGTTTANDVPIYIDPQTDETLVSGTVTTTVTNPNITQGGTQLPVRAITVNVTYEYRGRTRNMTLHTLRASDL